MASSQLDDLDDAMVRKILHKMMNNIKVENRLYRMVQYEECWVGSEAVDFLMSEGVCQTRAAATALCSHLLMMKHIEPALAGLPFVDGWEFYRFSKRTYRESITEELLK